MRMITLFVGPLLAMPAGAQTLRAEAEHFAGGAVSLAPRLGDRSCAGGFQFAWNGDGQSALIARCGTQGAPLIVPLQSVRAAVVMPELRRGDRVSTAVEGAGFRIQLDAVAERVEPGGRVLLRNARSGRTIPANVDADGQIHLGSESQSR